MAQRSFFASHKRDGWMIHDARNGERIAEFLTV